MSVTMATLLLLVLFSCCSSYLAVELPVTRDPTLMPTGDDNIRLQVKPGHMIMGLNTTYEGDTVYQFRGIPYAAPPVGSLRFHKPNPAIPWHGWLDATNYKSVCMQDRTIPVNTGLNRYTMSEDCLQLNIYVPMSVSNHGNKGGKPVMVWVHGGAFTIGTSITYDGSFLALQGDVIVVTVNYRLGFFGFYSTGDSASPGNYGLWDQRQAFQWTKDNIAVFGGDPEKITIFGESAGGFSVSLQALYPSNRGLFRRVIAQSGPALSPWAQALNPEYEASYIAISTGCLCGNASCTNT
jgi:carboxylesterase type B